MSFLNDYVLPSDVMRKIMTYIDVDKLFSMRVVSKDWRRSVRDKEFIKFYESECIIPNQDRHILVCELGPDMAYHRLFITMSSSTMGHESWGRLTSHASPHDCFIIGSVNGIICLKKASFQHDFTYCIMNPLTGQHMTFNPPKEYPTGCRLYVYWLITYHLICALSPVTNCISLYYGFVMRRYNKIWIHI